MCVCVYTIVYWKPIKHLELTWFTNKTVGNEATKSGFEWIWSSTIYTTQQTFKDFKMFRMQPAKRGSFNFLLGNPNGPRISIHFMGSVCPVTWLQRNMRLP